LLGFIFYKQDFYSISVWGEGVEGTVDLQIKSISAYGCASAGDDDSITIEDLIIIIIPSTRGGR